ncbi:MAG: ABC transporter ATP-binding protein [Candidatus Cloacimonetes bacterium]|nr:ABC transporter ATP-binding protein [Candidatus Cloacimonadota bacterium]
MNNNPIEIRELSFSYESIPVLEEINLVIRKQDFMAIIGPNGGGKTTLIKLILGELEPDKGTITVFGEKPSKVSHRIGYVPQFSTFNKQYPIRVMEVVLSGMLKKFSLTPFYSHEEKLQALEMLESMKIQHLKDNQVSKLSGGQMQRMLIARAMMSNPEILILDEPTASVDIVMEQDIFEILHQLNQTKTIIVISHDVAFVSSYANKVVCLNRNLDIHDLKDVEVKYPNDKSKQTQIIHNCHL